MIIINYAVGRRSFSQSRSTETTKLCCCFPADDDNFSKLKAVFLATGRGCRQDLPLVEVDNRLLVQLLLLKDEGSKTLDETAFFQQLLKPDLVKTVLLSHLRYLWSTDWRSCLEVSHFQNFHLFTAMAAASRDVNKWKRNLTQEMSTEPEEESEPDEPEFETSCRFQQEGDIVAVYNVEDFFISKVTRVISEEEAIVNFLEMAAVKMELLCTGGHALKITLKSPPQLCLPRICNLHLHHCLQGRSFFVESHRNLFGRYQAHRCYLQEIHL